MTAPVIRISIGKFDARLLPQVVAKLTESRARLEYGIRAMQGNLGYFAGVDYVHFAMHNVSFWRSVEHAEQMAGFEPMLQLAEEFTALGVRFERPILNFDTLWKFGRTPAS